jgi:CRP-like cAMP-binding protein
MPSVHHLKQRLAQTLRAKDLDAALGALSQLARAEPDDPKWPRRAAYLYRVQADPMGELAALRRALELQVDRGQVLEAIASCKAILELAPEDEQTLETLDLLYLDGSASVSGTPASAVTTSKPAPGLSKALPPREALVDSWSDPSDAPLDSLRLTEVVPGSRSFQLGDARPGRISEIPIDFEGSSGDSSIVDLRLEEWSPDRDPDDLAAAQSVCLPAPDRAVGAETAARGATLRAELANIPLFGDLDPASLHTLIRQVRVVSLEAGQVLFRQGDPANSLYVVVDGAVVPIAEGPRRRKLAVLERGEFFGEIGLMTKQPRNATIEALVDSKLLAIDRRVLWKLIEQQPSVAQGVLRFLRSRLIDRQIRTNLFFSAFAHAQREAVARQFRFLEVDEGGTVVESGRPPEGLFVVLSGSLSVVERCESGDKELAALELGDVFGGLSLIDGRAAPADVVATDKCWLVVLGEGRFRRILEANPRLDRVLRRLALEKGKTSHRRPIVAL